MGSGWEESKGGQEGGGAMEPLAKGESHEGISRISAGDKRLILVNYTDLRAKCLLAIDIRSARV